MSILRETWDLFVIAVTEVQITNQVMLLVGWVTAKIGSNYNMFDKSTILMSYTLHVVKN